MAERSQAFMWRLFGDARRRCWKCGKEPLRIKDVAEHRRRYPGGKTEFLCTSCKQEQVERFVRETRAQMGLAPG